jgi:DNA repair exonuclease SbcCD ATPase subunit
MIDPINLKVEVYPYSILEEIKEEIRFINIKRNNIEEIDASLNILNEKFKEVLQNIDEYPNDDNKKVLKAFLANEIHKKLKEIEKVSFSKEADTYKKMKSLRSKVNKTILENLDIDSNFDENPFFDEDYEYTIIKNTKKEKNILLTGDYINKFKAQLKQDFKNLQNSLKKFDKDEEEMNFIRKSMDKIEKLESEENKIMKEINKINQKNFEQGIEIGKNIVANFKNKNDKEEEKEKLGDKLDKTLQTAQKVGDNIFQIKDNIIDKNSLENKEIIINYNKEETTKLMHLHVLIEKIESVTDEKKEYNIDGGINGLMICKKINNSENQIIDSFNVKIIY